MAQPSKPSKGGAIVLFLFGLPFFCMGMLFIFAQISKYKSADPLNLISSVVFGLAFAGIGGGLMYRSIYGYGRLNKGAQIGASYPQSPWMWRPDWASRRAKSRNKDRQTGWWILAIFCSMVFFPFIAMVAHKNRGNGDPGIFVAIGLSLAVAILVAGAVRATIRWGRFGDAYFEFDALPFSPGARVSGRIQLRCETPAERGVNLELRCVRKVTTGAGDDRASKRLILWEESKNVPSGAIAPGPLGRAIPVDFELPPDALDTNHDNLNDQVVWELHAKAEVPGVNYTDNFEIPVFRTAESTAREESARSSDSASARAFGFARQTDAGPGPAWKTSLNPLLRPEPQKYSAGSLVIFILIAIAVFGWQTWRMPNFRARGSGAVVAAKTLPNPAAPRIFSSPMADSDERRILAQPAQEQAEELLERAIGHDERALHLLNEQLPGWVGRIQMTGRMTQLERRSEFSKDLRVRQANADLNLALQGWQKNQDAADALLERARYDQEHRAWAVYYLGMLAGRGVDYGRIHEVIRGYARDDSDPSVRQWAVEGLRFLGTDEALDELFAAFTEDPSTEVRNRAGCNLSDCGIFTRKQRIRMVPKFIELVKDSRTSAQMRSWSFRALYEITDENLAQDPAAWSRWYEEHGQEKMAEFERVDWWQVRGDE